MAAVDWQTVRAAMETAVALANGPDKTIGQGILNDLQHRGVQYDAVYTPQADAAKVAGDTAYALALTKWRNNVASIAGDMDRVASRAEAVQVLYNTSVLNSSEPTKQGTRTLTPGVLTPFDDPFVYIRTVVSRLRFAASLPALSDSWKGILRRYVEQIPKLDTKPPTPAYGPAYANKRNVRGRLTASVKQIEDSLRSTIAAAEAWMELQ